MGCCEGDDAKTLEGATEKDKAAAKKQLEEDDAYEPSGAGRIPGAAYTIGEVDIMECEDKSDLASVVKEHAKSSRGVSGCCPCSGSTNLLKDWNYIDSKEEAENQLKLVCFLLLLLPRLLLTCSSALRLPPLTCMRLDRPRAFSADFAESTEPLLQTYLGAKSNRVRAWLPD